MPALNTAQPTLFKRVTDLNQQTDPVDAKLDSTLAAISTAQQVLRDLKINPATGAAVSANTMPRPKYVVSSGGITSYETAVSDALTALTTAVVALISVQSLT